MPSGNKASEGTAVDYELFDIFLLIAQTGISVATTDLSRLGLEIAKRDYLISLSQLTIDVLSTLSAIGAYQAQKGSSGDQTTTADFFQSPGSAMVGAGLLKR